MYVNKWEISPDEWKTFNLQLMEPEAFNARSRAERKKKKQKDNNDESSHQ